MDRDKNTAYQEFSLIYFLSLLYSGVTPGSEVYKSTPNQPTDSSLGVC